MVLLIACPQCANHVIASERLCLHCGGALRSADGVIAQTAAALVLGLSVGCNPGASEVPVYGVASGGDMPGVTTGTGCGPDGGSSPIPPGDPLPTPAEAAATCQQPGNAVDVFDMAGIRAWLLRRWFFCEGAPVFATPHLGLEFAADGRWYFLVQLGDELARGQAPAGTWELIDNTCVTGFGADAIQIDITRFQSVTASAHARFAVDPLKLDLIGTVASEAEYVAVGEGPLGQGGAGGNGGGGAGGVP